MNDKPTTKQQETGIGRPPRLTWDVFVAVCATLRKTNARYKSCEAHGFNHSTVLKRMKEEAERGNTEWQELWDESLELFADDLEVEMHRRAVEGVDEPVFYKGEVVGEVTKYSDTLAITLAKATRPEKFRDNVKVDAEVRGGVLVVPGKMSVEEWLAQNTEQEDAPDE